MNNWNKNKPSDEHENYCAEDPQLKVSSQIPSMDETLEENSMNQITAN
jgi:hypothetical protein